MRTAWVWWTLLAIVIAYALFYVGGSYSFRYTHACAKSHKKVVYNQTSNNAVPHAVIICDRYTGNSKHWSPGDPARALTSERLTKYNGMILIGIVLVVGLAVVFERLWGSRRT